MRLARLAGLLLLLAGQAHATWSQVGQGATTCVAANTTCAMTFGSGFTASAGDIIVVVVGLAVDDSPLTAVDDQGSAYTMPTSCYANDAGSVNKGACGYCLSAHAGAATITITRNLTTGSGWQIRSLVFRTTVSAASVDGIAILITTTAALSTPGPSLTLVGTNDIVVQWSRSSATAITAPYTFVTGWGTATVGWSMNTTTAPAPTWTQSTSTRAAAGVIAIKEGGAAGIPKVEVITENRFP